MTIRILFVEDDPNLLAGLRRALSGRRADWELVFVDGDAEALKLFGERPFDVVVSDLMTARRDDARLLSEVKRRAPGCVRIALSGRAEPASVARVLGTAHQYLTKPCTADALIGAITGSLNLRKTLHSPRLRALVAGLRALPSLPKIYLELLEELESPLASVSSIAEIIARDVAMVVEVLRLMNSACFTLPSKVTTIKQAVNMLGFEMITALVLKEGIFRQLRGDEATASVIEEIDRRSRDVAFWAGEIAKAEGLDRPMVDEAFCAGMLSQVGTLVLVNNLRARYMEVLSLARDQGLRIAAAEGQVFGATHAEVGGYLLSLWGFHDPIVKAVAYQHHPERANSREVNALTALHVAQAIGSFGRSDAISGENLLGRLNQEYLAEVGVTEHLPSWLDIVVAKRDAPAAAELQLA